MNRTAKTARGIDHARDSVTYVHSAEKSGRDAGELCGLSPVGVVATTDIAQIISLRPDPAIANPEGANVDDMCRLLEAGINVIDTRKGWFLPSLAADLTGLPTWIGAGTLDLFFDEDLDYARRLVDAGVSLELRTYAGEFHGFNILASWRVAKSFARYDWRHPPFAEARTAR